MRKKILCIISCICFSTCMVTDGYADDYLKIGVVAEGEYKRVSDCELDNRSTVVLGSYFLDRMCTSEFPNQVAKKGFFYKDNFAWEKDLKAGNQHNETGNLYPTVDDVDIALFSGHGFKAYDLDRHYFPHNSMHFYTCNSSTKFHPAGESGERTDSSNLFTTEARWGSGDAITKWVVTYTCNFLNEADKDRYQLMQGIHMVLGYGSTMYIAPVSAWDFADRLRQGQKFIDAFVGSSYKYMYPEMDTDKNGNKLIVSILTAEKSYTDILFYYSSKPKKYGSDERYLQVDYKFKKGGRKYEKKM